MRQVAKPKSKHHTYQAVPTTYSRTCNFIIIIRWKEHLHLKTFSATAEIHPKPLGIPDSSPEIKDEPLSSPQARASTPLGLTTAPHWSARLSSKRSSALAPISFPSLDLSSIPGSGNLNLQLDPSIGESNINLQELVDFAESPLNPEGTSSQLSHNTVLGTAAINTRTNQKEVLLSVTGGSEGSTLTKEELLAGPSANAPTSSATACKDC